MHVQHKWRYRDFHGIVQGPRGDGFQLAAREKGTFHYQIGRKTFRPSLYVHFRARVDSWTASRHVRGRQQDIARHNGELRQEPFVDERRGTVAILPADFHSDIVAIQTDQYRGGQSDFRSERTVLWHSVPGHRYDRYPVHFIYRRLMHNRLYHRYLILLPSRVHNVIVVIIFTDDGRLIKGALHMNNGSTEFINIEEVNLVSNNTRSFPVRTLNIIKSADGKPGKIVATFDQHIISLPLDRCYVKTTCK